jgi:GH18 family chitinase
MATRQEQLLLSAAVCAEQYTILKAYEIENIVSQLDFISIMSYDYHGSWDKKAGHNSPLFESQHDSPDDKRLTVDWTVRLYLTLGVPAEKLIVGIPYYGRSFTLKYNLNSKTIVIYTYIFITKLRQMNSIFWLHLTYSIYNT